MCQTGCGCGLRCNVTTGGNVCLAPVGSKAIGEVCALGADDCAPGLACLRETCGNDLARCYRFCRDGSVCGTSSSCTRTVTGTPSGQRVCEVGDQDCDPYAADACPDPALHCYVMSASRTTCDCPGAEGKEGDSCVTYTDCLPGLLCVKMGDADTGTSRCLRLCRSTADCPSCLPLGTSISYCSL